MATSPNFITRDIHWVAGLIEGEGCFSIRKGNYDSGSKQGIKYREYPYIAVGSTDKDVIEKAHRILGGDFVNVKRKTVTGKSVYSVQLRGKRAIEWMLTLYSSMGNRRKERIKGILDKWKASPFKVGLA